jgi:ketosteroid isomerase-like protein
MRDIQLILDRVEIEALRAEFTDAAMMNDHDRLTALFIPDGAIRIPDADIEVVGHEQIKKLAVQRQQHFDVFVQNTHPGAVEIQEDGASGRAYVCELIRLRGGASHLNYAVYHDRYRRTPDGWRFAERSYEIRYLDDSPLAGSAPPARHASTSAGRD